MNKSKLAKSEICQKCAKCCKEFRIIEQNKNWALRWKLLNHPKIIVEEKEGVDNSRFWIIRIMIKCSKLRYNAKAKKYYCEIYKDRRPDFCETYPDNIPTFSWGSEKDFCSIINKEYIKARFS